MEAPYAEKFITKLVVEEDGVRTKIEVTPVLRGCVCDPQKRAVLSSLEDQFGFAETQVVSFADLCAGKLVDALNRQHPRDLFAVRDLLANEGIGEEIRKTFIVQVLSHNRPIAEVLAPTHLGISQEFARGFERWLQNLARMDAQKHERLIDCLIKALASQRTTRIVISVGAGFMPSFRAQCTSLCFGSDVHDDVQLGGTNPRTLNRLFDLENSKRYASDASDIAFATLRQIRAADSERDKPLFVA